VKERVILWKPWMRLLGRRPQLPAGEESGDPVKLCVACHERVLGPLGPSYIRGYITDGTNGPYCIVRE
jgi:hypothetical protein